MSHGSDRTARRGYTLVEMAVVVAVIGIVGIIAVPAILKKIPRYHLRGARSELFSELRAARRLALTESRSVEMDIDASARLLRLRIDRDGDGIDDPEEQVTLSFAKFGNLVLDPNATNGLFRSRGTFTGPEGFWRIKLSVENAGESYVYVFPSGLVEMSDDLL